MGADFPFWGDENVLRLAVMMAAHHGECSKSHGIAHLNG